MRLVAETRSKKPPTQAQVSLLLAHSCSVSLLLGNIVAETRSKKTPTSAQAEPSSCSEEVYYPPPSSTGWQTPEGKCLPRMLTQVGS